MEDELGRQENRLQKSTTPPTIPTNKDRPDNQNNNHGYNNYYYSSKNPLPSIDNHAYGRSGTTYSEYNRQQPQARQRAGEKERSQQINTTTQQEMQELFKLPNIRKLELRITTTDNQVMDFIAYPKIKY